MATFVAGSHELSPSINYLLHNKLMSGQLNYGQNNLETQEHDSSKSPSNQRQPHSPPTNSVHPNGRQSSTKSAGQSPGQLSRSYQNNSGSSSSAHLCRLSAVPPLPPIKAAPARARQEPLTIEEYERHFRQQASDLDLVERVHFGGIQGNQLRAALWPYIFGLVKRKGRFLQATSGNRNFVYIEHEENIKRWRELERLYYNYEAQWKSIMPDQELRFSTFRERKSLIERDVIRSDRSHPFYADNGQNLTTFTSLLMTYMMYDFDIGYLQGMSDLAAPILYMFKGNLVKSFWVFVEVMKLFRRNFEQSQKSIHFQLNCLFRLIKITDAKLAQYLKLIECSNCFFAFRCIVCQFKREIMKDHCNDDYTQVLTLWDSIWSVQRRYELLTKSKYVHTFTIASGTSKHGRQTKLTRSNKSRQQITHTSNRNIDTSGHKNQQQQIRSSIVVTSNGKQKHLNGFRNGYSQSSLVTSTNNNNINNNNNNNTNYEGLKQTLRSIGSSHSLAICINANGYGNALSNGTNGFSPKSFNGYPLSSLNSNQNTTSNNGKIYYTNNGRLNGNSCSNCSSPISSLSSYSPESPTPSRISAINDDTSQEAPVKQEQIVYTKETFYSSFDPNQADVPRFELSETEKFVLSLCLSLIRRERNTILAEQLDTSEIHQHFMNPPRLAYDLDNFIGGAHQIYQYLNTDCDLQLLVRGASELAMAGDNLSDLRPGSGVSSKEDTADTYDLLRDYLIISPSSYNTSSRYKCSVSQKSWDQLFNQNNHQCDSSHINDANQSIDGL